MLMWSCARLAPSRRSCDPLRAHGVPTILSFHDLKTTPPAARLDEIVFSAQSLGAALIKVATRTDTPAQLDRLFDFFERHRLTANIVPMASENSPRFPPRVRKAGGLTYAHLGTPAAAGQLSIRDLRRALG